MGTENWPGAVRVWRFDQPFPAAERGTPPQGLLVYRTTDWSADIGHLSHANAQPGVALDQQYVCGGNASRNRLPRNNEILCFRLDGSLQVLVVAPVMTDLNAAGGGSNDYSKARTPSSWPSCGREHRRAPVWTRAHSSQWGRPA